MSPLVFLAILALALGRLLYWAVRRLPEEHWQILAAVPLRKRRDGGWDGANLTTYGLIQGLAVVFATAVFLVAMGAVGVAAEQAIGIVAAVLAVGLTAAHRVASWVEGKAATLTIGGAVFTSLLTLPSIWWLLSWVSAQWGLPPLPGRPALAALVVAYAFGEGVGRLACISFGCCYGRALADLPEPWARLLRRRGLTFRGVTKKIAYASGLDGVPVAPIQAVTSAVLLVLGLAGLLLYLYGAFELAFATAGILPQVWRIVSERFRADFRGGGRFSAYQWMALAGVALSPALLLSLPTASGVEIRLVEGLAELWSPWVLLTLQATGLTVFVLTGWSRVTGSRLTFHVDHEQI